MTGCTLYTVQVTVIPFKGKNITGFSPGIPPQPVIKEIPLLKGPKHEIFESGFFTQIIPVLIGHLGTRPKNS